MANLPVRAVRWVRDEPFPGWVEVELTDAHGHRWVLADKPPIFGGDEWRTSSDPPTNVLAQCTVIGDGDRPGSMLVRRDHGLESVDGVSTFSVWPHQVVE